MSQAQSSKVSPLEAHLGFWLRYISNQVSSRFENQLEANDITVTEWVAMQTLFERPHKTHAEHISALGMTKGATSKGITKLENKGIAARHLVEDSAREQVLPLTADGKQLLSKLAALADGNDQFFFGHLAKAQRSELMTSMQALVRHHQLKEVSIK